MVFNIDANPADTYSHHFTFSSAPMIAKKLLIGGLSHEWMGLLLRAVDNVWTGGRLSSGVLDNSLSSRSLWRLTPQNGMIRALFPR